jgi:hypothetical protein
VPLSIDQLLAVAEETLAAGPFEPFPDTTATPDPDPCADGSCETAGSDDIDTHPLIDALAERGIETTETGGYGGGAGEDGTATVVNLLLTDEAGRIGSASIGIYSDLSAAQQLSIGDKTGAPADWCAVAPVEIGGYQWSIADDPSLGCADVVLDPSNPLVVVHDEPGAGAIGATVLLADGSVVSVSVSQAIPTTISSQPTPLAEVPLDRAGILDVLQLLAATTGGATDGR